VEAHAGRATARGRAARRERLRAPAGQRTWPYNLHWGNEELLVVLEGTPTLRTPDGERELSVGDAAIFRCGRDGAHALVNGSSRPVRVLVVSTMIEPDICEYPDSDKVGLFAGGARAAGAVPGAPTPEGTLYAFVRLDEVDYFDGEPPPETGG
jgi:hypothetical protein